LARITLRKTSLIDYPGLVSAVIFFSGCNLRCPWCYNRELVDLKTPKQEGAILGEKVSHVPVSGGVPFISLDNALAHIEKRRKVLGGVVLSGGEPTLFAGLGELIRRLKSLGLKVKLDTNGTQPDVLETLFCTEKTRPDYVAMDLKLAPERYVELLAFAVDDEPAGGIGAVSAKLAPGAAVKKSAALIRASGIEHEFRSLALPAPYFDESDIIALKPLASGSFWRVRPFVPGNCLNPAWNAYEEGGVR
jgi:pyruvate formate lyase activating enzyme